MRNMNWAEHLTRYYREMVPPAGLPAAIGLLYPHSDPVVIQIVESFYSKFYADRNPRIIFLGINPGRYGAGVTGVNFTAPRQLRDHCGIDHPFKDQSELSAEFIYEVVEAYGGAANFFGDCFLGSVSPLGFISNGRNINYYDDKELLSGIEPFIIHNMKRLLSSPLPVRSTCICIGGEKNFRYLLALNSRFNWFKEIIPVPHPRFIMQYRRSRKAEFVGDYLRVIEECK
jgi:hypothetical protein